jgi:dihydrofolate synthase / folylpolyglutamate synthase
MANDTTAIERYLEAQRYIDVDVVRLEPRDRTRDGKLEAVRRFNAALGDPQAAFDSIQVAGTSGKGSVCTYLAHALHAAGARTGLHVSPYLQVITEKTWCEGRYCGPGEFADAVDRIRPVAEEFRRWDECPASVHGMASLAASYEVFRTRGLDTVVMETGVGGRFDLVQGLRKSLTVITDLGLDHTKTLGESLDEIAWHKAGIIEPGVPCVAVEGPGYAVIEREAMERGAPLFPVRPEDLLSELGPPDPSGTREVVLRLPHLGEIPLRLPGVAGFQARNAAVAAAALDRLAAEGAGVTAGQIIDGFARARYPGRFEQVQDRPRVILDGAHNPQKMAGLLDGVLELVGRGPLVVLAAFSGARAPAPLIATLSGPATSLVATRLDLYGKATVPAEDIADAAREVGLPAQIVAQPMAALEAALHAAGPDGTVLVTGSLYLVGLVRDHWHPWREVLLQGTSWPT